MPVLKVKCCKRFLSKRLDISIQDNKHNGIACVSLVRDFLAIYEHLKPLVLVFKYFLQKCSLADTYQGGLSSYGLILMIVSFFQSKLYTRPSPSLG
jgi:non-canonical poly(A) RNA polymerase PAPD5/7